MKPLEQSGDSFSVRELLWRQNYRSACRARSAADFISKISVVAEETDETLFWLELLVQAKMITAKLVEPLMNE
jgi:four helix bundle protein